MGSSSRPSAPPPGSSSHAGAGDQLAALRHELVQPLQAIHGFVETLVAHGDRLPEGRRREALKAVRRNIDRIRRLVEDPGAVDPNGPGRPGVVELGPLLDDVVADLGPTTGSVRVASPPGLRVLADAEALVTIVSNLVGNALKHGAPPVTVTAGASNGTILVAVDDRGPGVDPGFVPRLFERYARGDDAWSRPGSGIGLALSRDLAHQAGGSLRYQPTDAGARFVLELPRAPQRDESAGPAERVNGRGPRLTAGALQVEVEDLRVRTTTRLTFGQRTERASRTAASSARARQRAVAEATLDAVESFVGKRLRFDLEAVGVDGEGDHERVTVQVTAVDQHGYHRLVGAAYARGDPSTAVMRATLDSINRRIEPVLT